MIKIKRVYESPGSDDGVRILVDRLWPRGLSKEKARIDEWKREMAPSNELRKWYGHDPAKWDEFKRRYLAELQENCGIQEVRSLAERARRENITLLFAASDEKHANATFLRELISSIDTEQQAGT